MKRISHLIFYSFLLLRGFSQSAQTEWRVLPIELDKLLNEREDKIFIIDKEDENGKPVGTKVIISFKESS